MFPQEIASSKIPQLLSTKTMFVRLENFTQNCVNARMGNRSKIIAHLPRFDGQVETGRIFHQPHERVYLDLNNSEPLRVNSFDISFCYTNEQYATNLTGNQLFVYISKRKVLEVLLSFIYLLSKFFTIKINLLIKL